MTCTLLEPSTRNAETGSLILDAALETLSRDQTVAVVDWASASATSCPSRRTRP